MRYTILASFVLPLGAVLACGDELTSPTRKEQAVELAAVAASRTELTGLLHPCGGPPGEERTTRGGTLHIRDAGNRNQWVTGHPLVDGFEVNVTDLHINLKTGDGIAHANSTLTPAAVNGTWEIRYHVEVEDFFPGNAHGVGHGTGDLHGMTLKFSAPPPAVGANVCNPEIPIVVPIRLVIISPATAG